MTNIQSIAFLCHPYHRGGVTRWMADAAIKFSTRGIKVYFVTIEPQKPFLSGRTSETMVSLFQKKENNILVISEKAGREFEFGTNEYCIFIYKRLLTRNVPPGTPVILSDDNYVWAAAASLHKSFPLVGVLHSDEQHYYDLAARYKTIVDIFPCVSERVHISVSRRTTDIDAKRIFTIPCGIELPPVNYNTHTSDLIKLIYVGRLTEYQKRISDVARIARSLKKQNIDFHLTIVGDGGADKTILQASIKEDGMDQQITFTGWLSKEKVQEYLYESDVMILTSDFEGTPISMMEALASGCGFVGTRVSGIEDYEQDPLAAACFRVYDTGDTEDAAKKIKQLATIPLQTRQTAARKIAESFFSMDICLDNYMDAISTIKSKEYERGIASIPVSVVLKSKLISSLRVLRVMLTSK